MPRPPKCRTVNSHPVATIFKPAGIPKVNLEEIVLTLDEFEALRLTDFLGLYQDDAAASMQVSRQTLGNILVEARRKVADCLVNGKALRIEGGNVNMNERIFECLGCAHRWPVSYGVNRPNTCPACGSDTITRAADDPGRGHGQGCCRKKRHFQRENAHENRNRSSQ